MTALDGVRLILPPSDQHETGADVSPDGLGSRLADNPGSRNA